jgi:integrase
MISCLATRFGDSVNGPKRLRTARPAALPARRSDADRTALAGVDVHPHALRHAFSVRFLEQHPGEVEALQRILGHSKMETTQRYLRSMDQERLTERMRDLSWGTQYEASVEEAPSGFEPLYGALQAPA